MSKRRQSKTIEERNNHSLRLHRSESWSDRAQRFYDEDDPDSAFLFYWIAFNALYSMNHMGDEDTVEKQVQRDFITAVHHLDIRGRLYDFAWEKTSDSIRNLLNNAFIYGPYWREVNEKPDESHWQARLRADGKRALQALREQGSVNELLARLFDRLNVLRNQLAHGSATYHGSVNREQVKTGASFLHGIMPIFQDIFREHPDEDWGEPPYPPQEK